MMKYVKTNFFFYKTTIIERYFYDMNSITNHIFSPSKSFLLLFKVLNIFFKFCISVS